MLCIVKIDIIVFKGGYMGDMLVLLHEQLNDYSDQLKIVEKEIVRKYKAGENYQEDVAKANGMKMLQKETVKMMASYGGKG